MGGSVLLCHIALMLDRQESGVIGMKWRVTDRRYHLLYYLHYLNQTSVPLYLDWFTGWLLLLSSSYGVSAL